MKIISIKCPECGASLNIEDNREQIYCSYCGSKLYIHNENEYIVRKIDEAKLKEAETEQMALQYEIEKEKIRKAEEEKSIKMRLKIAIFFLIAGSVFLLIGIITNNICVAIGIELILFGIAILLILSGRNAQMNNPVFTLQVPLEIKNYKQQNYKSVEMALKTAGFTNILCIPVKGILRKQGTVASIKVCGLKMVAGGSYLQNAPIVVTYYE